MKTVSEAVSAALRFDPLGEAERLTGDSYKTNKGTEALGFLMHIEHNQNKRALLEFAGDTHFGISWVNFLAMLPKLGFEVLFVEPFKDEDGGAEEAVCAWDEKRGALLWAETYRLSSKTDPKYPPGINSGNVYFCWRGDDRLEGCSSSPINVKPGEKGPYTCAYSYDIREGLKHLLETADARGQYVNPWPATPFLWLLTYMDAKPKGYDYKAINAARMAKLPAHVLSQIAP